MNNNCLRAFTLCSFLLWTPALEASESWQGMSIVRYCTGDAYLFNDVPCRAYIQGVIDSHEFSRDKTKSPPLFCPPRDLEKRSQGEAMIAKWLEVFPEKLRHSPIEVIEEGLSVIFPCQKPESP